MAFGFGVLLLGGLRNAVEVFVFDEWASKFGPWGTFEISGMIHGVISLCSFLVFGLSALLAATVFPWPIHRNYGFTGASAVVLVALLEVMRVFDWSFPHSLFVWLFLTLALGFTMPVLRVGPRETPAEALSD